jgi:outer membrane usher protein
MSRFGRRLLLCIAMTLVLGVQAAAEESITPADYVVHAVTMAVSLNGVDVSDGTTVYLAEDGTVYVSQDDLSQWGLKYPAEPALTEYGEYYALQSQLNLAVAVDEAQERLEIIAPPTAFLGGPERLRETALPGRGAFLNYKFDYRNSSFGAPATTTGAYTAFFTQNATTLQLSYQSVQTSSGISFVRQPFRLYRLDVPGHREFQIGEGSVNAGDVGSSPAYLGIHIASRYVDPLFVTHALPSVTGVATTPSVVQVFVNNQLIWRDEVQEGPFTVRDLPASAAYSDVVLVLTDANGHQTSEVVRPSIDQQFLRPGLMSYSLDAGPEAIQGFGGGSVRYGNMMYSTTLRYGLTPWLTLQGLSESVEGKPFAALGFQASPGPGQLATFWYGDGKIRKTGRLKYELRTGKFNFSDDLKYTNEINAYAYEDGFLPNFQENMKASYSPNYTLSFALELNRYITNAFLTSTLMFETRVSFRSFTITLRPTYDNVKHLLSARLDLTQRLGMTHGLRETVDRRPNQPATTTMTYNKYERDENDPWTVKAEVAEGYYAKRELEVGDRMPWSTARIVASDQSGTGNITGELSGSLAAAGLGINTLRNFDQGEVLGVVRLPGFPGVRIDLNGSPAGYTDKNGNLILRQLSALQENTIVADISTVPLDVGVRDPISIVPLPSTPVSIDLLDPKAQSVILRIADANGKPLPQASRIVADDGTSFPIGFDGRTFIRGLAPGSHTFTSDATPSCQLQLTLKPLWEIVDGGTVICR